MQVVTGARLSQAVAIGVFGGLLFTAEAARASDPWPAREPSVEPKPAHQLRNPSTWPAEPQVPLPIDPTRFQDAFAYVCEVGPQSRVAQLAPKVLEAAAEAESDPFTLAALARFGSKCDPAFHGKGGTHGLLGIEPGMYRVPGAPPPPVDKEMLTVRSLRDPATNLAVGAALLQMWESRHKEIDEGFGGVAHRGALAHMVWGDEVRSSGQEDHLLTLRRRMVQRYLGTIQLPRPSPYGIQIVSPLDGTPRVASSGPGEDRDGGARKHRGLDLTAVLGEPVRSIADGTVIFAGVNMPGKSRKGPIPPEQIKRYAWRRLGVGGIYLCIEHTPVPKRIVSCYMHLASYVVAERAEVKAGELIGYVGRTGVKVSPPHLHFEVRVDERFTNPVRTLGDYVIPPQATTTYMYNRRRARLKRLRAELPQAALQNRG